MLKSQCSVQLQTQMRSEVRAVRTPQFVSVPAENDKSAPDTSVTQTVPLRIRRRTQKASASSRQLSHPIFVQTKNTPVTGRSTLRFSFALAENNPSPLRRNPDTTESMVDYSPPHSEIGGWRAPTIAHQGIPINARSEAWIRSKQPMQSIALHCPNTPHRGLGLSAIFGGAKSGAKFLSAIKTTGIKKSSHR